MSKKTKILLIMVTITIISMLAIIINQQNKIKNNEIAKAQEIKRISQVQEDDKQKKLKEHNYKVQVMRNNIIDKTERIFRTSEKIKNGEIKSVNDAVDELDSIEQDTYKMNMQIQVVVDSDPIKEDGLNDTIIKMSKDLDNSIINMRLHLSKKNIDGFNVEFENIVKISEKAESLIYGLN